MGAILFVTWAINDLDQIVGNFLVKILRPILALWDHLGLSDDDFCLTPLIAFFRSNQFLVVQCRSSAMKTCVNLRELLSAIFTHWNSSEPLSVNNFFLTVFLEIHNPEDEVCRLKTEILMNFYVNEGRHWDFFLPFHFCRVVDICLSTEIIELWTSSCGHGTAKRCLTETDTVSRGDIVDTPGYP